MLRSVICKFKSSDSLRKLRNVARFLLGNTNDFEASDDDIKLRPLDRYVLSLLQDTTRRTFEAYENYQFAQGFRTLLDFVNNDMSSFYLDSCKDLLYADNANSDRRRAAQFTMLEALRNITLSVAPVAVYTAEDIFEHARTVWPRGENIESVFQHVIDLEDDTDEHVNVAMWNEIRLSVARSTGFGKCKEKSRDWLSLECAMSLFRGFRYA